MSVNKKDFKEEILDVLDRNFGMDVRFLYEDFYQQKSNKIIMMSSSEILSEMIGAKRANNLIEPICKKYNVQYDQKN